MLKQSHSGIEQEIAWFQEATKEFSKEFPEHYARLFLDAQAGRDPHVERLIMAFAMLTARIGDKLDAELPEIIEALLNVLAPHYTAPVPSMAIVQCSLDPQRETLTTRYTVEQGTQLVAEARNGKQCAFRTCYPVTLWPIRIVSAQLDPADRFGSMPKAAAAVLRLELECLGKTTFSDLPLDRLRFFLDGNSSLVHTLYELIFNNACQVALQLDGAHTDRQPIDLPLRYLRRVGFEPEEGLLPYSRRTFLGYRLLQEYFTFPEKFLFFDIEGLDRAVRAGCGQNLDILIFLDRLPQLPQPLGPDTFRLGCTPIVNLFETEAEPIRLTHTQYEYRVLPDLGNQDGTEVYRIDNVESTASSRQGDRQFKPFYAFGHRSERQHAFWYATRRPSQRAGDAGTDVFLSLVDLQLRPTVPEVETLRVFTTCTNRDLPETLLLDGGDREFQDEETPQLRVRCLTQPTKTLRPPLRHGLQWRLISHLALNYLSLCDDGAEALQEILRLYNFADSPLVERQIAGITHVSSSQMIGRLPAARGRCWGQGLQINVEFDEGRYPETGVYLFTSVLDVFLSLYASINSFTQLCVTTKQRKEPFKQWNLRKGAQILL